MFLLFKNRPRRPDTSLHVLENHRSQGELRESTEEITHSLNFIKIGNVAGLRERKGKKNARGRGTNGRARLRNRVNPLKLPRTYYSFAINCNRATSASEETPSEEDSGAVERGEKLADFPPS